MKFFALVMVVLSGGLAVGQIPVKFVNKTTVLERVGRYKGNDVQREATLKQMFVEAGCPNLTEQPVPHRKQPNVICVLPPNATDDGGTVGANDGAKTIVVGAHFDHVDAGQGIVDNWSGASMLPSVMESLLQMKRKHRYVFVGFTGEEDGLLGSAYYVKQMTAEERQKTEAMVNMDTLGLGPTLVWVHQSDPWLTAWLSTIAKAMKLPLSGMNVDGFGESDEESFIKEKICTVMVHSLTPETTHVLHRAADNPSAMKYDDYYDTYRLMAAFVTALDVAEVPAGHSCTIKPVQF